MYFVGMNAHAKKGPRAAAPFVITSPETLRRPALVLEPHRHHAVGRSGRLERRARGDRRAVHDPAAHGAARVGPDKVGLSIAAEVLGDAHRPATAGGHLGLLLHRR